MPSGTTIGVSKIKARRLDLELDSYPGLHVGDCVPFYFCPRSVMLYLLHRSDHVDLAYRGGQEPIVHLEADLNEVVRWAKENRKRWVFTLSNAGSRHFEDRASLDHLHEINWNAVAKQDWRDPSVREGKQAEFLIEHAFPWFLVRRIGVQCQPIFNAVNEALKGAATKPRIEIVAKWYY